MKDLTKGRIGFQIFKFAVPMLIGQMFQQLYTFVDQVIVGNYLGKEALAAVGASFPIIFTLIALVIGIASGGTIVISQYFGAKDFRMVKRAINTVFILLLLAAVILTSIGLPFLEQIFRLMQLPEELMEMGISYLSVYLMGLVLFFGYNGVSAILRGLGDSVTPLYFLILATVLNIGLDLLFIVKWGWGVEGAAWATIIAQGVAFITAAFYLNSTHELIKFNIREFAFDKKIFKDSFRIGLPTGLQHTFVALGMMALMGIVNTFGTNVTAAYTAAGRLDSLAVIPAMVFAQALSTYVGQNLGAGKLERVNRGLWTTLFMSSTVSLIMTAIVIIFKYPLMGLFTEDPNVIQIGGDYLTIVTSFYIIFTSMFIFGSVMRGAGDTLIPMFITLISLWAFRIPAAYFLSQRFGESGIWWAIPIGWTLGTVMTLIYYKMGRWKNKVVVKQPTSNASENRQL
ncbi:MAG TPA: MATE family efflux transporter [Bacteroidales bacterium]|nr:MATE family efflux transporter [Bacteroidales bacterium]